MVINRLTAWTFGVALVAALAPAPVVAADRFTPPEGCTVFVTVQSRGCKVSHHYTCQGDAAGDQWRIDFDREGPFFVSRIDRETRWMRSFDLIIGQTSSLSPDASDDASFTGLLETGTDTYDFRQDHRDAAGGRMTGSRVRGFDTLTGRKVTIDGQTLDETNFEYRETADDGSYDYTARGKEYVHRDWRLFFAGPSESDNGQGPVTRDRSPARFDLPGEPGHLSNTPEYDCDDNLATLVPPDPGGQS